MNQEYLIKLSMLEQQANQFEEQLKLIEQEIAELRELKLNLDKIKRTKEIGMLAGLGKGIFIQTKLDKKEKELFVNIGSKVIVKKSPSEVKEIIEKQTKKLEQMKPKIHSEVEKIKEQLDGLVKQAQEESKKEEEREEEAKKRVRKKAEKK